MGAGQPHLGGLLDDLVGVLLGDIVLPDNGFDLVFREPAYLLADLSSFLGQSELHTTDFLPDQ